MVDTRAKHESKVTRHHRIRRKVSGTADRPRLVVYRSLKHIYAQLIDDVAARTIVAAGTDSKEMKDRLEGNKTQQAKAVGKLVAEKALAAGVKGVAFDRGGYRFHGRVKALAEAAREAGLQF
jgi:large subunit ribosomal protein L18